MHTQNNSLTIDLSEEEESYGTDKAGSSGGPSEWNSEPRLWPTFARAHGRRKTTQG